MDATKLKAKGWSDYEIHQAMDVLKKADANKHPKLRLLDENIYWLFLVIAVLGNIAFSVMLFPIVTTLGGMSYVMAGFIGVVFGTLCTNLVKGVENLEKKHHIIYSIIIPVAGLVNYFIITNQANLTAEILGMATRNPYSIGIIYLVFFFLPFFVFRGDNKWI